MFLRFFKFDRERLYSVMTKDAMFLRDHNLMDYSFLFAVERVNQTDKNKNKRNSSKNMWASKCFNLESSRQFEIAESRVWKSGFIMSSMLKTRHQYYSSNGKYIYHIAIIDYLQEFDLNKRLESFTKIHILSRDRNQISAVDPHLYCSRFLSFMRRRVLYDQNECGNPEENGASEKVS
mmetsp:Transcript_30864/g.30358  ORF Transcript_30864/g.30358 Transcript_30864/m.30358 type:complete len:178 (-) Transcript_30864:181-714(-)